MATILKAQGRNFATNSKHIDEYRKTIAAKRIANRHTARSVTAHLTETEPVVVVKDGEIITDITQHVKDSLPKVSTKNKGGRKSASNKAAEELAQALTTEPE